MSIKYKVDVLGALKAAGYTSYKLRKEKIIAESTLQKLRGGVMVDIKNIGVICGLLNCQPGDLIEYVSGEQMSDAPNQ